MAHLKKAVAAVLGEAGWGAVVKIPGTTKEILNELTELALEQDSYLCRGEPTSYDDGKPSLARTPAGAETLVDSVR